MKKRPPQRQIKRVGIYNRVSTEEQVNGYSLDMQVADATTYVKRRWPEAEIQVYTEQGESGTSTAHRDAFHSLIADARGGRIDAIVVHKLDRFARSREDSVVFKSLLARDGVYVYSVTENIDPSNTESILIEAVLEGVAEYYSANLSTEVKKGLRGRALDGYAHANVIPFGYCNGRCLTCKPINPCPNVGKPNHNDNNAWYAHPVEAQAIREAYKLYLQADKGYIDIAVWLNSQGLKARRKNNKFHITAVGRLFANKLYQGLLKFDGEWLPGKHPQIVPPELWEQVKEKRTGSIGRASSRGYHDYIAKGLLECAHCHRMLYGSHKERGYRKTYYTCEGHRYAICDQPLLREDRIAETLDKLVASWKLPPEWRQEITRRLGKSQEIEEVNHKRTALEARLTRAKRLYLEGDLSDQEYEREARSIRAQLAGLQPVEITDIEKAGEYLDSFPRIWEEASVKEKNLMLRQVIQKIVVDQYKVWQVIPRPAFSMFFLDTVDYLFVHQAGGKDCQQAP